MRVQTGIARVTHMEPVLIITPMTDRGEGKNQVFCMVMIFCMSVHAQSIYRTKVVAG